MRKNVDKKLFRKNNTTAHGCNFNKKYKDRPEELKHKLHSYDNGVDYTPLFKYLLSSVGKSFDLVYGKIKNRILSDDPIFWLIKKEPTINDKIVRIGESSYYSGLYIDENGIIQLIDDKTSINDVTIHCNCCTYTFNGKIVERKFQLGN